MNIDLQVYLEVKCGSVNELDHEQGIAHFVEHAVFLGTEKYPNSETIKARLAALGMSFGADSNAYTDFRQVISTQLVGCRCRFIFQNR